MSRETRLLLLAILCVITPATFLHAQACIPPEARVRVHVSDNGTGAGNIWFGFHPGATSGVDAGLCEIELPPAPPAGVFHTCFVGAGLGQGVYEDYRPFVGPAHIDTHRVRYQPGDMGYPFTFRWDPDSVLLICDSAIVIDMFGGFIARVNMVSDSVLVVSHSALASLFIIRYGQKVVVNAVSPDGAPLTFQLHQNYPNPFNPKTIINYQHTTTNWVTLKVFDVLGHEVAIIVNGIKGPGTHTAEWDAGNQSSGVYFYRLSAGAMTMTRKMLLVR